MVSTYNKDLDNVFEWTQVDSAEPDYVYIDSTSSTVETFSENLHREPESLSSQTMVSWQKTLLQDPKNR